jgi:hypothetical protein
MAIMTAAVGRGGAGIGILAGKKGLLGCWVSAGWNQGSGHPGERIVYGQKNCSGVS